MITALLILSFYSVVGGWSLDYIIDMGEAISRGRRLIRSALTSAM